jgi:hypothetical protein
MQLGAYEVTATLGEGGMGVVYGARSPDGQAVAIKLLRRSAPEILARFEREKRLLASFGEAEGFVPLLDSGSTPRGSFLVMPLVSGGTLRRKLESGPLAVDETIGLGRALAAALASAHARGIVHRDMKPENILFTAAGRPLVADLGIAKHFDQDAPGASQSVSLSVQGNFSGTAGYMAPEQMVDAKSVGPPADIFSLGAILHECLAGEPAFQGASPLDVIAKVDSGMRTSLAKARPDAPRWFADVIARALARKPGDRFLDGAALGRAIEAGASGPPHRSLAWLLGAVALASLLVVAALALRKSGPAATTPPVAAAVTSEAVTARLTEALAAAQGGDAARARALLRQTRDEAPALAADVAIEIGARLDASRDWSHLATASEAFLALDWPPERRRLLEDWRLVATVMLGPEGGDLEALKKGCAGRTGLETTPLGPIVERLYAKALEPVPSLSTLLLLCPLPPAPAQRKTVAAIFFEDARRLQTSRSVQDRRDGFVWFGEFLDRLRGARGADPAIPSLPDELESSFNAFIAILKLTQDQPLPPGWERAFDGDRQRPGYPDHPLHAYVVCLEAIRTGDFTGSLASAARVRDAIGAQRTRPARRLAEIFVTSVYLKSANVSPLVLPLLKEFAAIADSKLAWRSLETACGMHADTEGAEEAHRRAEEAEDIPE